MRYAAVAVVACLGFWSQACGSSSDESAGSQNNGGTGPGSGTGGLGGAFSGAPEDFGYAAEDEPQAVSLKDAGPASVLDSTICGSYDVNATKDLDRTPTSPRSLASVARARELIHSNQAPISTSLRVGDHLQYYRIGADPAPIPGKLTTTAALRAVQIAGQPIPRRYQLFVGVTAGPVVTRPPVALTVVVDTTPSMAGEPLARAKKSLRALADALLANDHLTVLTTGPGAVFDQGLSDPSVDTKDLEQKLDLGEETALRVPIESALDNASSLLSGVQWNQVVVISDGQGDPKDLPVQKIADAVATGIRLSSVGVGGGFVVGDALLFEASRAGRGSYAYVDDLEAADGLLRGRFDQLYGVLANDVHVKVALPWLLESLDKNLDAAGLAPVQLSMAPGESLALVFNLRVCDELAITKYGATYPIAITTSYVNPTDKVADSSTKSSFISELLKASPAGLDGVLATRAYVSAMKGPTKERFADALALLGPLKQPGNSFDEMWSLLDAYPKKP